MGTDFGVCIRNIKKKILLNDQLFGFVKEKNELLQIVKKTTDYGESDSVIVLGPRGCGKSVVMHFILYTIKSCIMCMSLTNIFIYMSYYSKF